MEQNEIKGGGAELPVEVIARETHERAVGYFKIAETYTYKFIMEVKEIRDSRLYKALGYSDFDIYCKEAWGVDRKYVSERIKIADSFGEELSVMTDKVGHRKSLLLARFPESEREKIISSGIPTKDGEIPIEEATRQQISEHLAEIKRLQQEKADSDARAEQAEQRERLAVRDADILRDTLESIEDSPPEQQADDTRPYGVKLSDEIYAAFDEMSEWQKKYSWILTDRDEFKLLTEANPDFAREFNRLDKFWSQLSIAFHSVEMKGVHNPEPKKVDIIDVEFTEII
ncbi:hypothetical protein HYI36_20325 [Bacillus sp. Gen3]|nr:hypothetical protein [Bacillus sp. Gen3]